MADALAAPRTTPLNAINPIAAYLSFISILSLAAIKPAGTGKVSPTRVISSTRVRATDGSAVTEKPPAFTGGSLVFSLNATWVQRNVA